MTRPVTPPVTPLVTPLGGNRRLRRDRRGVAAIEFALTMPLLLLAFVAMFETYQLVEAQRALDFAVSQALRYGAVRSASASAGDISHAVRTAAKQLLGDAGGSVDSTIGFSPAYAPGDTLRITATYAWSPVVLTPAFPAVTLRSSGVITVQN